jgi:hypothetical protein
MDLFSWLKRAPSAPSPTAQAPDSASLSALAARVGECEVALKDLTMLRLEWSEVLDKLQAWTNRQTARDARRVKSGLSALEQPAEVAEQEQQTTDQQPITKAELRRRLASRFHQRAQGEA